MENVGLDELSEYALSHPDPALELGSGQQELYEMVFNELLFSDN